MKDVPIIFSAPMVLALLDGRKTMTRRLAWRSQTDTKKMDFICDGEKPRSRSRPAKGFGLKMAGAYWLRPTSWVHADPGDRLWVRESFAGREDIDDEMDPARWRHYALYRADDEAAARDPMNWHPYGGKWKPSIHMPRWASRLTLDVTAVKIEHLQDISKADCIAEGMADLSDVHAGWHQSFAQLWNKLHGDGAWEANPEVVAVSFNVHKVNIDEISRVEAA